MADFAPNDLVILLLAISTMLILSRIASEIGRKFGLPMVMGELLVGVALGPTLLGTLLPGVYDTIFPFADNANFARSLETIFSLSVILLLFVAGLELRFSLFLEYGVVALTTGIGSMVLPFVSGLPSPGISLPGFRLRRAGLRTCSSPSFSAPPCRSRPCRSSPGSCST